MKLESMVLKYAKEIIHDYEIRREQHIIMELQESNTSL